MPDRGTDADERDAQADHARRDRGRAGPHGRPPGRRRRRAGRRSRRDPGVEEALVAAFARDVAADRRDRAAHARDAAADRRPVRGAADRAAAAERGSAALDREQAGRDRDRSAGDRLALLEARATADARQETAADERDEAALDRMAAEGDRVAAGKDREAAAGDRADGEDQPGLTAPATERPASPCTELRHRAGRRTVGVRRHVRPTPGRVPPSRAARRRGPDARHDDARTSTVPRPGPRRARRAGSPSCRCRACCRDGSPFAVAVDRVTHLARAAVPGADEVSLTIVEDGEPRTVASTSEVADRLDRRQYGSGAGPCLEAATTGTGGARPGHGGRGPVPRLRRGGAARGRRALPVGGDPGPGPVARRAQPVRALDEVLRPVRGRGRRAPSPPTPRSPWPTPPCTPGRRSRCAR